ncbi:GNAT family N-acetyltransferase [Asticcacaulis sp. YBE204]|uniref:GNAT family N-acetyltransferase n=1 Tax=Asticcacaulis sp. YBE204 TaxID=1282363 RepID=UPI001F2E7B5F|nr:GNAT family N-acetyltransferase [Asticcacaulis sp. YBE204]
MNEFLQRFARQSHDHNAAKTFCAIKTDRPEKILGFYTITPSAVSHDEVPTNLVRGLARHEVSGFKLARIATDTSVAGLGLGGQLLAAAALRCLRISEQVGGRVLIIDANNERAAAWYGKYGAEPLKNHTLTLIMPLATFASGLREKGLL